MQTFAGIAQRVSFVGSFKKEEFPFGCCGGEKRRRSVRCGGQNQRVPNGREKERYFTLSAHRRSRTSPARARETLGRERHRRHVQSFHNLFVVTVCLVLRWVDGISVSMVVRLLVRCPRGKPWDANGVDDARNLLVRCDRVSGADSVSDIEFCSGPKAHTVPLCKKKSPEQAQRKCQSFRNDLSVQERIR